jgi:protein-disulfide isomerase
MQPSLQAALAKLLLVIICVVTTGITNLSFIAIAHKAGPDVVARVNGVAITQKQVDDSVIAQLFPLEQQIYAIRKTALENLVVRVLLEGEAKKRGISVDELRKQLTLGNVEVSPNQVDQVYSENAAVFAAMSPDEARERLRLDLESQARIKLYREALAALKKAAQIEVSLESPRLPSVRENASSILGSDQAAVTVIEFSDFQCPYCRESESVVKRILAHFKNDVKLVFKHLPGDAHEQGFASARAAYCAGEQGSFSQYHDDLFASEVLSNDIYYKVASKLGLNQTKFQDCLNSEVSRNAVLNDLREAKLLGINSTPTFIINGTLVRGAIAFEDFKTLIEEELKSAKRGSPSQ